MESLDPHCNLDKNIMEIFLSSPRCIYCSFKGIQHPHHPASSSLHPPFYIFLLYFPIEEWEAENMVNKQLKDTQRRATPNSFII